MTMLHEKCKISHIVLNINNIQEYVFCKRDCFKMYIADYVVHVKSELKVKEFKFKDPQKLLVAHLRLPK